MHFTLSLRDSLWVEKSCWKRFIVFTTARTYICIYVWRSAVKVTSQTIERVFLYNAKHSPILLVSRERFARGPRVDRFLWWNEGRNTWWESAWKIACAPAMTRWTFFLIIISAISMSRELYSRTYTAGPSSPRRSTRRCDASRSNGTARNRASELCNPDAVLHILAAHRAYMYVHIYKYTRRWSCACIHVHGKNPGGTLNVHVRIAKSIYEERECSSSFFALRELLMRSYIILSRLCARFYWERLGISDNYTRRIVRDVEIEIRSGYLRGFS